jgi:glutamine synthetase
LTLAVCLAAGLNGITNQIEPPKCVEGNIFAMKQDERSSLHIENLPGSLLEALEEMEKDNLIKEVLGNHIRDKYLTAKKEEWVRYRSQVTEWEIKEYLNRF